MSTTNQILLLSPGDTLRVNEGTRKIRDILFDGQDIQRLVNGLRLTSTVINAVNAAIQAEAEATGNSPSWCIFSSWLGPLVEGVVKEGGLPGTILGNIKAAVPNGDFSTIIARTKWLFPLCSLKEPAHWVLAWVDYAARTISIFDSIPELGSSFWAEPMMLKIIDRIRIEMGESLIEWSSGGWQRKLHSPPDLQKQIDAWSCGVFVFMAVREIDDGESFEKVGQDRRDETRRWAMNLLLSIPVMNRPSKSVNEQTSEDDDLEVIDGRPSTSIEDNKSSSNTAGAPAVGPLPPSQEKGNEGDEEGKKSKRKRSADSDSSSEHQAEALGSDGDASHKINKRRKQLPVSQREKALRDDPWVVPGSVSASQLRCKGCNKVLRLNPKPNRPFESKNWNSHKAVCSGITGVKTIRTQAVKPKVTPVEGKAAITAFFPSTSKAFPKLKEEPQTPVESPEAPTPTSTPASDRISYKTRIVAANRSIAHFFSKVESGEVQGPVKPSATEAKQTPTPCIHLSGPQYDAYLQLTQTRNFGGISPQFFARVARQVLPYKDFPALKQTTDDGELSYIQPLVESSADDPQGTQDESTNTDPRIPKWTDAEKRAVASALRSWVRWKVNYAEQFIVAAACHQQTLNKDHICDACKSVASDTSFKAAVREKRKEANLSADERRDRHESRVKHANRRNLRAVEYTEVQTKLKDPVLFDIYDALQTGDSSDCFLLLYKHAKAGALQGFERFTDIATVLAERVTRDSSGNANAKYGIRYPETYLNFMTVMRGYGQNSNRQYSILAAELAGPSSRHLRSLVAKSVDALQNPYLIYENVARLKRYLVSVKYTGPIIFAADCTKVHKRMNFSTQFGRHVLGTTYSLSEVEVDDAEDIDEIVSRAVKEKAIASQARAMLTKIPLPGCPAIVIALLPTDGSDTAEKIHQHQMQFLQMAATLKIPVIASSADGASSELLAQRIMDNEETHEAALTFDYSLYGVHLRVPVFKDTGPLVSVTDAHHAQKTARNQPQHGTHTASMGTGYLVNQSFVDLYRTGKAGLVLRDVENVDKQDDGAARRVFHFDALLACTDGEDSVLKDKQGVFVYIFIFGLLFEAWLNPTLCVQDRVLSCFRARFFLHIWYRHILLLTKRYPDLYSPLRSFISIPSFHILNRLCDTLVLLALAYSRFYVDQPFCPWLISTEFVEHFFGIARQLLPNFTYAEFLKMVQHIMVRQRILEKGILKTKQERTSAVGYIIDFGRDTMKRDVQPIPPSQLSVECLRCLVEQAFDDAARIAHDILHLPVPKLESAKPIKLHPLSATIKKSVVASTAQATEGETDVESGEDPDEEDLTDTDSDMATATETAVSDSDVDLTAIAADAARASARYSALSQDFDAIVEEAGLEGVDLHLPAAHPIAAAGSISSSDSETTLDSSPVLKSQLLDLETRKISIRAMVALRKRHQSGTMTKSERTVKISPHFALHAVKAVENGGDAAAISVREASQRVRIAQDLNDSVKRQEPKKTRQMRWTELAKTISSASSEAAKSLPYLENKNVTALNLLQRGGYAIMRTERRYYVGQVLDIYKRGQNGRHGSIDSATSPNGLSYLSLLVFLPIGIEISSAVNDDDLDDDMDDDAATNIEFDCSPPSFRYHLHTHAPIENLTYYLGLDALEVVGPHSETRMRFKQWAADHWVAVQKVKGPISTLPPIKIRIPARVTA